MKKSEMFLPAQRLLSLVVLAAVAMAVLVSPVLAAPAAKVKPTVPAAPQSIDQTLEEEYREITGHIRNAKRANKAFRARIKSEALDPQAMVTPDDTDPLDVVLRRTIALIGYFNARKMLPAGKSTRFANELLALSTAAAKLAPPAKSATPPKGAAKAAAKTAEKARVDARKKLFKKVCALRRRVAFANPLVNFDKIVCMLEQPGSHRIIEQARASYRGHSKGGGPIIVRDFKSKITVVGALAGVKVATGPWKGKDLVGKFSGLEL
jgi:hypothetical protein